MGITGNIDAHSEDLLAAGDVCTILGGRVSWQTVNRWMTTGVKGGEVNLDAVRIGRRLFTSRQALDRFCRSQGTPGASEPLGRAAMEREFKARGLW